MALVVYPCLQKMPALVDKNKQFADNLYATLNLSIKFVDKSFYPRKEKMRSAGFEPAIPSLGSSYLDQAGLTSLRITKNMINQSLYILSVLLIIVGFV